MGNSLRCCLACVLPCEALDVIRIVHLNGYVEEITRVITAREILGSYRNHVLSKPCSQGMVRKIMILSPDSELKRGGIYFLIPDSSLPNKNKNNKKVVKKTHQNLNKTHDQENVVSVDLCNTTLDQENVELCVNGSKSKSESESKSESKQGRHQRRRSSRGKSGIWQPHLQSITEDF